MFLDVGIGANIVNCILNVEKTSILNLISLFEGFRCTVVSSQMLKNVIASCVDRNDIFVVIQYVYVYIYIHILNWQTVAV